MHNGHWWPEVHDKPYYHAHLSPDELHKRMELRRAICRIPDAGGLLNEVYAPVEAELAALEKQHGLPTPDLPPQDGLTPAQWTKNVAALMRHRLTLVEAAEQRERDAAAVPAAE